MPLHERPEPVGPRIVGRAVVHHQGAARRERADDLPRTHDPPDVGEPEQALARPQVGLERDLLRHLHGEPSVHVHGTLRPPRRSARVRDEQRMFAVDRAGGERRVGQLVEPHVAAALLYRRVATTATHHQNGVHARHLRDCGVGGLLHRDELAAAREAVGGHDRDGLRVVQTDRDRVGAVTREDRQEDRAELRDREQRRDGLGHHRHEEADGVAFAHTSRRQSRRDAIGERAQLGAGERASLAVLTFPDHGRTIGRQMLETHRRRVASTADEPRCPLDARRRIEHAVVGSVERQPEEPHHRVPEPLGFVDRARHERCEALDLLGGHEASDVAPAQHRFVGTPDDGGSGHRPPNLTPEPLQVRGRIACRS